MCSSVSRVHPRVCIVEELNEDLKGTKKLPLSSIGRVPLSLRDLLVILPFNCTLLYIENFRVYLLDFDDICMSFKTLKQSLPSERSDHPKLG